MKASIYAYSLQTVTHHDDLRDTVLPNYKNMIFTAGLCREQHHWMNGTGHNVKQDVFSACIVVLLMVRQALFYSRKAVDCLQVRNILQFGFFFWNRGYATDLWVTERQSALMTVER
jgi:hypothetical protein